MSAATSSAPAAGSGANGSPNGATGNGNGNGSGVTAFVSKEEAEVTTVAGRLTAKNEEQSYIGGCKDGDATEAEFCFPNGLALNTKDKSLFVSDSDNRRVRRVDLHTGVVSTFAGGGGTGYLESRAYPFENGHGEYARFGEVRGICLDAKDNLYVADMFHYCVRKVSPDAEVSTFAGQPKSKQKPADATATATAAAANGANGANGAAANANGSDAAATPTPADAAPKPDPNLHFAEGPATDGAKFNRPSAVAVDRQQNVYVCDFSNNRIRKVTPDGQVSTFAGSGRKGYKDGPGKEAAFNWPNHITIDRHGNLFVAEAENYRIRKVSPTGLVSTYAGSGVQGFQDGAADRAKFDGPNSVAVDADGFVYVTEDENHRIRMISPNGVVRTLAGTGERGESNGTSAATAQFAMPTGLIVDPDTGHLYVCDYGNHLIRKVHQRAVAALKAAMLKETDGRFPPMPQIDEEDDKQQEADANADPVSTNSRPSTSRNSTSQNGAAAASANTTASEASASASASASEAEAEGADGSAAKGKREKKRSKSKKREKTEQNGASDEGKSEESVNGSGSAAASGSREGAAVKEGDGAAAGDDANKSKDDDADSKSCRMCQSKNGCALM